MAKSEEVQLDLFPVDPEITGLGITKFETKGAEVVGTIMGVTNVHDIALLTNECWKKAVSEWLVMLCENDSHEIHMLLGRASEKFDEQHGETQH